MRCLAGPVLLSIAVTCACGGGARGGASDAGTRLDAARGVDAAFAGEGTSTVMTQADAGGAGEGGASTDQDAARADAGSSPPPSTLGRPCGGDAECDDGLFCNGQEACPASGQCVAGDPPALDDGVACSVDQCLKGFDTIVHMPDHGACADDDPCTEDTCASAGCTHAHDFGACPCVAAGACDPFAPAPCSGGEACRPTSSGAECRAVDTPELVQGDPCLLPADADRCGAGLVCLDFGDGLACHRMCPSGSIGVCGDTLACLSGVGGDACIGICRPPPEPCDILAQNCADPDDTCTLASHPETGALYTGCRPAGPRAITQLCGGSNGACGHGLICLSGRCRQVCDPNDGDPACSLAGQTCTGLAASYGVPYCE